MIECTDLGLIGYREAWEMQEELRAGRERGQIPDRLLLLEHPPVFTMGRRDCAGDIVSGPDAIARDGIAVVKTNRGGRITYHGPGQLVGYFICNLNEVVRHAVIASEAKQSTGIKGFVWLIEELLLRVLSDFGIEGTRDPEHPGIWVENTTELVGAGERASGGITQAPTSMAMMPSGPSAKARSRAVTRERRRPPDVLSPRANKDKIAAIGLHVSHGITQHGFALNVDPDLGHYRHIIPCGIKARGVTSMGALLREPPSMDVIKESLMTHLTGIFGKTLK